MKYILALIFVFSFFLFDAAAQNPNPQTSPSVRPRIISAGQNNNSQPQPRPTVTPNPTPAPNKPRVVIVPSASPGFPSASPRPTVTPAPQISPNVSPSPIYSPPLVIAPPMSTPRGLLNFGQVRAGLAEAKRFLQSRPQTIALTDDKNNLINSAVTLALLDPRTNQMQTVTLPKETFLTLFMDTILYTSTGKQVRLRTIRANGVNTAVIVVDQNNQPLVPLVAQYPVERGGKFYEMAYYTSAHPALMSAEIARAGQLYIRTTLETALKELRLRGKFISPQVIAEAEKLCLVEHVDHQRFLNENRSALYDEIFTLFALNEGQTYRYAVSTAGAGGLVQMIPSTYRLVRAMHPNVPLVVDFVEGMRNHNNAMQAMLLYMQDTYSDLVSNETISNALAGGVATDAELMAAGYNSNPARLQLYIRRGGNNWRNLIPRETQMYLQIQKSIEATIKPLPAVK